MDLRKKYKEETGDDAIYADDFPSAGYLKWLENKAQVASYFPIQIRYIDTSEIKIIKEPNEISCGRSFIVLKTNA